MRPDFFIVGAPRCGTTSLYHYLGQHPQVQMSTRKEPGFFHFVDAATQPNFAELSRTLGQEHADESKKNYQRARAMAITERKGYQLLWSPASSERRRGEATPTYLFDRRALESIRRELPTAKALVILRNPVERAYSEYLQLLRKGVEPLDTFANALDREPDAVDEFWWGARSYVRSGLYADRLEHCLTLFGQQGVRVILTEDLAARPVETLQEVAGFLAVDPSFDGFDTSMRHKPGFVPRPDLAVRVARSPGLLRAVARTVIPGSVRSWLWKQVMGRHKISPPPLDEASRQRLADRFRASTQRLEELIDRDLSHWS